MIKSIRIKISLILVVFLLFSGINVFFNSKYFRELKKSINLIMDDNYDSIVDAQKMIEAIERQDSIELAYIFGEHRSMVLDHEENHMKFLEWLYKAKGNITESGEKEILNLIENDYKTYSSKIKELEKIKLNQNNDIAMEYYYTEILPLFTDIKEQCNELLELNQQSMLDKKNQAENLASAVITSTILITIITIIMGIAIISYLLKKIITPIEDLATGIGEVSKGNYEYSIPLVRDKELNYLLNNFNNMIRQLKEYQKLNYNQLLKEKQKTEAIIESIDSPIIVTDDDNKIIMLNKSAERLFDVKEKSIISRHFLEGIDNRQIFDIIKKSNGKFKESNTVEDIEININEENIYLRIRTNPIWFDIDENIGTVTIMEDITKFKEIEKLKSEFVSTVSHEFRTPLTSICMAVDLLLENEVKGEEGRLELLNIIKEDSEKLDKLVGELLDLSKMESGRIEMDIQNLDVRKLIEGIERTFMIQLEEKKINLITDFKAISSYVKADINKISWVIVNLLGNALRYTKNDGTGSIEIKAKEFNNNMLISVADNGEGISEESQKIIFEKFVQLKDRNGDITGNSGLGLAICREIVKAHSGDIWVDSTLGEGSCFYFTLKLGGAFNEENINS